MAPKTYEDKISEAGTELPPFVFYVFFAIILYVVEVLWRVLVSVLVL